jgi:hypothetical protein
VCNRVKAIRMLFPGVHPRDSDFAYCTDQAL